MDSAPVAKFSRTGTPKSKGGCATCRYPALCPQVLLTYQHLTGLAGIEGSNVTKESLIVSVALKPSERAAAITLYKGARGETTGIPSTSTLL